MEYLHTMVRVADLDKSLDFYCNKLGLVEVRRMENEKGRFTLIYLATPEDVEHMGKAKAPNGVAWNQLIADFDAIGGAVPPPSSLKA